MKRRGDPPATLRLPVSIATRNPSPGPSSKAWHRSMGYPPSKCLRRAAATKRSTSCRAFTSCRQGRDFAMHADLRHVPGRRAHPGRGGHRTPLDRQQGGDSIRIGFWPPGSLISNWCICARRTIQPPISWAKPLLTHLHGARRQSDRHHRRSLHRVVALRSLAGWLERFQPSPSCAPCPRRTRWRARVSAPCSPRLS